MEYVIFQTTEDPYQVFYLPASPDGHAFSVKVEMRYLPGTGCWVVSIADAVTGQVYVPYVPVRCSYEQINDLLFPFRFLFQGSGIGSLFCLRNTERPGSVDPEREKLGEFQILWGDRYA